MAKKFLRERRFRSLTPEQVAKAKEMWHAGDPECEICLVVGMTVDTFRARRHDQLKGLPKRKQAGGNSGRRAEEVTPEELEFRKMQVQSTWTEEDRMEHQSNFIGMDNRMVKLADLRAAMRGR
jgi:hypothetical protein